MVNETELTDEFKKNLKRLKDEIAGFERDILDHDPSDPIYEQNARAAFTSIIRDIREKIHKIKQIGVNENRINQAINKILERVRNEVLTILRDTKMSETEIQIFNHLDNIDRQFDFSYDERKNQTQARQIWTFEIKALEELNITESDLVKANERVLQILDRLVKAAEKLE